MAVIAIFSASDCHGEQLAAAVAVRLGYELVADQQLVATAAQDAGIHPEKLKAAMSGPPRFFNRLTREKEKHVALLRATAIQLVGSDNLVYLGFGSLLIPKALAHVLQVCIAAPRAFRLEQSLVEGFSRKDAERRIQTLDNAYAEWTKFLFDAGPWDKSLYDIFIAMQSTTVDDAVKTLCEYARRPTLRTTKHTPQAVADAALAARVNMALVQEGHDTDVSCRDGHVTILIRDHTLRLGRLQNRLRAIASRVPGVKDAVARPGPRYQEPSVYAPMDLDVPAKVLLVDDETEFVHALSERLQTRGMAPSLAYDGAEALSIIEDDQPEVMILDLKMPGIDGLEVLRQVKQKHPDTEVIILTGHGSEAERVLAAQLGAFAYLHKPVDIDVLTETMKAAYKRINAAKCDREESSPPEA